VAAERRRAGGFVDECSLNVKAGAGGAGCISFRRETYVPRGGPDGGDGGKGGDIWLVADRNVASLLAFRDHPHRKARSGVHGKGKRLNGQRGEDLVVAVPEGTTVRELHTGILLADLVAHGDRWLAARGGQGGKGNAAFLSNRRRAPSFAEQGELGEERWLRLELRLAADVALVGFPNVGKSTLISRVSAARPKIADYPFTTLEPNLGVVRTDDAEFVVADIPGLVEGASEGKGLGHQFLRHIERTRALVVLCDLGAPDDAGVPDPSTQQRILLDELAAYQPALLDRPRMVVGSRADLEGRVNAGFPDFEALRISAVDGTGLPQLVGAMADLVAAARAAEPERDGFVIHRPEPAGFKVERDDRGTWVVSGRSAERAVALSDLTNAEALNYARQRLNRLGVDRALARAGARSGDSVRIGGFEFDYEEG
jgi:GTP-binding protein